MAGDGSEVRKRRILGWLPSCSVRIVCGIMTGQSRGQSIESASATVLSGSPARARLASARAGGARAA